MSWITTHTPRQVLDRYAPALGKVADRLSDIYKRSGVTTVRGARNPSAKPKGKGRSATADYSKPEVKRSGGAKMGKARAMSSSTLSRLKKPSKRSSKR